MGKQLIRSVTIITLFWIFIFLPGWVCAENPILIGTTVSLQGKYAEPSAMIRNAYRLWETEVNEQGGLLGRPVKILFYDDKSDPELSRQLFQKLVVEDKVDLVLSPNSSPLTQAASEVSEQHKLVMVACSASSDVLWERGYRYLFGVFSVANRLFIGQLDIMAGKGYKTVALVYDQASSYTVDVIKGAEKWAQRFKMQVIYKKGYTNAKMEFPAIVDELARVNAKGLILAAYPADSYEFLAVLQTKGFRPNVLGITITPALPEFHTKAGPIAEGIFGPSIWEPDERIPFPGTKRFITEFTSITGEMPSYHAASAYAACQLLEDAIRATGSLDNDKIRDYIADLNTVTVIGRFKVDTSGKQVGHNPFLIQWQNSKKEIVWPVNMRTAEPAIQ